MGAAQFFGILLIVGGVLLAVLCGLCTLTVIGVSFASPGTLQAHNGGAMIPIALVFSSVPMAFGALMIWAGVVLVRTGRKSQPPGTSASAAAPHDADDA